VSSSCKLDGCDREAKRGGWCWTHYMRVRRHGDPGPAEIWSPGQGLAARFWAKVDKNGPIHPTQPELGQCWVWTAAAKEGGYGVMRPEGRRTGPTIKAHRVSLIIDGRDPGELNVLHSCDNPPCVNPAHLRAGTLAENRQDALDRNRIPVGSQCARSKLTEAKVGEIWQLINAGVMYKDIAPQFGVSRPTISNIALGQTWRHVTPPTAEVAA
jgi:hypothetical protein